MTERKLTPIANDRVIVSAGEIPDTPHRISTSSGVVERFDNKRKPNAWQVEFDDASAAWFPADRLTVVDREPVEWPEGWGPRVWEQRNGTGVICSVITSDKEARFWIADGVTVDVDFETLCRLAETVPEMVARWAELVGESE